MEITYWRGQEDPYQLPITGPQVTLGRQAGNSLVLDGPLISRQHARIQITQSGAVLTDLDSTNGTWMNGQRIVEVHLPQGASFQIGAYIFTLGQPGVAPVRQSQIPAPGAQLRPSRIVRPPSNISSIEITRPIGEGGAAIVYHGRDRRSGQDVAVKVLQQHVDIYFQQKFGLEAEIGMRLDHPRIVRTLDIGMLNGSKYIVMEFMPGGSLRQVMGRQQLSIDNAIDITADMCMALGHAHQAGIFHRDIKPENILFDSHNRPKLADFGIARLTGARTVTREGMLIGTPEYMSYEQAKGAEIDDKSDQYSLAIVLYEMLTNRPPFQGEALTVVSKHLGEKPVPPRQINNKITKKLNSTIMTCLEKDRRKRFSNMHELASALGRSNGSSGRQSIVVPPPPVQGYQSQVVGKAQLVSLQGGSAIQLTGAVTDIGRQNVGSDHVSRDHARVTYSGGAYVIEDLGSTNGTFVDGNRIARPARLQAGSVVELGPLQYRFVAA